MTIDGDIVAVVSRFGVHSSIRHDGELYSRDDSGRMP